MKYKTKYDEELTVLITREKYSNAVCLYALNSVGKEVGFLRFLLNNEGYKRSWLNIIEVEEDYLHRGVGSALINIFEYISVRLNCFSVEGRYYPKNEYAKPFYEKHGYEIFKDGYEQYISKRLESIPVREQFDKNAIITNVNDLWFMK